MSTLCIEIDCHPGTTRPDIHFKNIMNSLTEVYSNNQLIKEFVEKNKNIENISACFGNWEWNIKVEDINVYNLVQTHFKKELTNLYNSGCIRYASC